MKTIKVMMAFALAAVLTASCSGNEDEITKPVISDKNIVANPVDCQEYARGTVIPVQFAFHDDVELGSYNIEIHNNFNHHTHGTSATDCTLDDTKMPVKAWVFNQDYPIPAGRQDFVIRQDIKIPADIDPGDYHFMIRLTNKAGWQELKGISIKITE